MRPAFYGIRTAFLLARFAFRFLAGRPLGGERKTNATFTQRATRSLDPSGRALRWEMLAGWERAAWRLSAVYAISMVSVSLLLLPFSRWLPWYLHGDLILRAHVLTGVTLLIWWALRRRIREHGYRLPYLGTETTLVEVDGVEKEMTYRRLKWYEHEGRRTWEQEVEFPLGRAIAAQLSVPAQDYHLRGRVNVSRDYRDGGPIEVRLPDSFTGADEGAKRRLVSTVGARLSLRDELSASWLLTGSTPLLRLHVPPAPPKLVTFSDVRRFLEATGEWDFFYGVTAGGEGFSVSISGDTPHSAISAGSGAGKSQLLRGKIMQAGHRGWSVIVLDWKTVSQRWCRDLHGVRYVTSVAAIHDMCVAIGEEIEWRKDHIGEPMPRVLVVAEEWGITAPLLAEYWSTLRSTADPIEKQTMPLRSPALTSMMKLVFTGRELGLFEELVAQRFSARVTNGNADLRESFQVIHMARWKAQTVRMLAPDVKPFPRKPREVGRWVAVNGDQAVIYQAPLYTDDEAREWFSSGQECPASPFATRSQATQATRISQTLTQEDQLPDQATQATLALPARPVSPLKLSDIGESLEHLGITLKILRLAANEGPDKDPDFPAAIEGDQFKGYRYSPVEVTEWARRRHARMQTGRGARR